MRLVSSHTLKKLLFVCHSCSTSRLYVGYYYKMAFQSYLAMIHLYLCCAQIICTSVNKPFAFANYVLQFAKTLYAKKQVFSFILDIYTYISRVYIDHLLFHCKKKGSYGICSLLCLGCHGCYLPHLERLSLVGMVHLWAKSARRCGEQLLFTYFGRFGRREIDWPSMMMCYQSRDSNIFLFFPFG